MASKLCFQRQLCFWPGIPPRSLHSRPSSAISAFSNSHTARYVTYIHRSVHSNEKIESGGCIIIHGHVDQDAYIQAAGDVMVWGRLAGHVHAGCEGDTHATISALELRGAQLRIADVTSMAAARVTVPGPHTARVSQVGRGLTMQLEPLGPCHPPAPPAGLAKSFSRWLSWYPTAMAALITGAYALLGGLALIIAPKKVLGLLFNVQDVSAGWIRLGGVLFATFGMQYLGTALIDWRLAHSTGNSSIGAPDMPFRPASPHGSAANAAGEQAASGSSNTRSSSSRTTNANRSGLSSGSSSPRESVDGVGNSSNLMQPEGQAAAGLHSQPQGSSTGSSSPTQSQHKTTQQQPKQQQQHAHHPTANTAVQHAAQGASWLYSSLGFYEASVWSRLALAAAFTALVVLQQCQPGVLLLAVLNVFGAVGMMNALQKQWLLHVMGDLPNTVL